MSMASVFDDTATQRLEAVYLTPDIVKQRKQVLEFLELQPGETVLDVGSGPGLLMEDIAEIVGDGGQAIGVDLSDSMLALSRRRFATSMYRSSLAALKADATALPFPDERFDVAVSTQVLEYVPDVDAAIRELFRVLRPGGRILILDTDWDSLVWNTADRHLAERFIEAWTKRFPHPHLPRTLTRRLEDAGFHVSGVDCLVLLNSTYDPNTYSLTNGEIMATFVQDHGLSAADVAKWNNSLADLGRRGLYFFSLNRYLFTAHKDR